MDSYNLTHTGAELDSAVGRALEGFAAADAATKAANDAAKLAEDTAAEVQKKLDNGEFVGPIGKSGVYVGSGDMPEGYTVQVDPTGDMLCYTAGESDSRYLRATEIRRPFTGGGITLTDADDAAFGGVTVLGATTETGTGDKGPDNPYALTGVQPIKVTVCGKNLLPSNATSGTTAGLTRTVDENGVIHLSGTASSKVVVAVLSRRETPYFWLREKAYRPVEETKLMIILVAKEDGTTAWTYSKDISAHVPCGILSASYEFAAGAPDVNTLYPYLGLEPNQPYEPYTGQTVHLPALEPLYGAGDIRDEYDAVSGVETRRWKRVVFDGTEKWNKWREDVCIYSLIRPALVAHQGACNAYPIFKSINWNAFPDRQFSIETKQINFRNDACADVDSWKAYLNAQATAGTPVTVVYQLDAPVVTQHGPQRIPTYPGYTNLMMDISAEGAVQYPISAAMQWDAKADKAAVYDRDTADSRFAGVLTGTASGPVAALEDVSPTGALRRAAVLGATTETGEGDKSPDNPYTLAGVQPTKVTVCGKNLLPVTRTAEGTYGGVTITPLEGGLLKLSGTCTANNNCPVFCTQPVRLDGTLTATVQVQSGTAEFVGYNLVQYNGDIQGLTLVNMKTKEHHFQRTCMASGFNIRMDAGTVFNDYVFGIQLEKGDTATPYEPYTGQTITLPALAPLYGDRTVNDEYDAVSGVETRRWKRVVFDGTESMRCEAHGNGQRYVSIDLDAAANKSVMPISTHYTSSAWTQDNNKVYIPNPVVMVITDSRFTTLQAARDILAAQYAAGTPVTVVYQLAEPVITQHDPARILPPAPVCRVFADAGSVDVGYNRDVNTAFEQQRAEYLAQIKALDERIKKLEAGQPAEPMT